MGSSEWRCLGLRGCGGGGYIVVVQRFYWRAKAIGHGLSAIRVYDQDFDGWHGF